MIGVRLSDFVFKVAKVSLKYRQFFVAIMDQRPVC
jgi:hypothetical protein